MIKRFAMLFVLLGIFMAPVVAFHGTVAAAPGGARDAAAFCQELNAEGVLAEFGVTVGECVNLVMGPASENANNFVAAICGVDFIQESLGATSKGQCIKVARTLFSG